MRFLCAHIFYPPMTRKWAYPVVSLKLSTPISIHRRFAVGDFSIENPGEPAKQLKSPTAGAGGPPGFWGWKPPAMPTPATGNFRRARGLSGVSDETNKRRQRQRIASGDESFHFRKMSSGWPPIQLFYSPAIHRGIWPWFTGSCRRFIEE